MDDVGDFAGRCRPPLPALPAALPAVFQNIGDSDCAGRPRGGQDHRAGGDGGPEGGGCRGRHQGRGGAPQGQGGRGGPGDALIEITIRPHPLYRREADTLIMDVPISVPDAVLGGKVTAPTPDGAVSLSVPRSANSGQTLRLKGRGMPDGKGKRGDLLARLVVTMPDHIDTDLIDFCERWRAERNYTPKRR